MAKHSEALLARMWNNFSDSDKQWIGQHCNNSDLSGYEYADASKYMKSPNGKLPGTFRNAIIYVSSGRTGQLYKQGKNGKYVNNLYS